MQLRPTLLRGGLAHRLMQGLLFGAALGLAATAQAAIVTWDVSGGQMPDAQVPQWQLIDTANPENPLLADGRLLLGGNVGSERMAYTMSGSDLDLSVQASYWIEARLRVDTRVPYPGWFREPVQLAIRFANGAQAVAQFGLDSVYLMDADNSQGARSTALDTDTDFHLWRLEVLGQALGSTVHLYQDGVLVLSDRSYTIGAGGAAVTWGESSVLSGGRSSWQSVATNMARLSDTGGGPTPASAPGTLALAGLGLAAAWRVRRERARART
jgi:MYXO-CTERM domain-containing protein